MLTYNEREIANIIIEALVEYGLNEYLSQDNVWDWFCENKMRCMGFWASNGATKTCIGHEDLEGWVIKVGHTSGVGLNYARLEYDNYREAVACGLAYYFPETYYLGEFGGQSFFLQQEVECDEDQVTSDWYERLRDSYDEDGEEYDVDQLWDEISNLEDDEKAFLMFHNGELSHFLCENRINDLHEGNFGYINGRCVIIDFSGYRG
jgi:hypothetical protein